jgi:alkaline phosphatase
MLITSLTLLISACGGEEKKAKNIIFMIGDGMGVSQTTAYRYYADDPKTPDVETTVFDELLVGTASTYPADDTVVTDSAASATALSSGIKSYNGAIGVDVDKKPVLTLLERAKQLGMTTAIVATSQINHATPASFMAHNESRRNYNEIADAYADELINDKPKADLMLGGGTDYFIRDDRNIVDEFKAFGYHYIDSLSKLNELSELPALGLFAPTGMPHAIDSDNQHRVAAMTKKSLELLDSEDNKNGFFIMIEGSQIDWCAHNNDIACSMKEMDDFAHAIKIAKEYVDRRDDTILVITADHTTGGLSLGANGDYRWEAAAVKKFSSSLNIIISDFMALPKTTTLDVVLETWVKHSTLAISEAQATTIQKALASPLKQSKLKKELVAIINSASNTGWTTGGHSAEDVQVFATGVNAHLFNGHQNNTDIAKKLFKQLQNNN